MERIYLDVCCLNRAFDDQSQARVRAETEALRSIFGNVYDEKIEWISSEAVDVEIDAITDSERRSHLMTLLSLAKRSMSISDPEHQRAGELQASGFHSFDAL